VTIVYHTVVLHIPPTPLGLLPERWTVQHWCNLCRRQVAPAQLVAHAQDHERTERPDDHGSFQSPRTSGTLASDQPTTITDEPRR